MEDARHLFLQAGDRTDMRSQHLFNHVRLLALGCGSVGHTHKTDRLTHL